MRSALLALMLALSITVGLRGHAAAETVLTVTGRSGEVNRSPVESVEDFSRKMEKAKSGDHILLRIQRGGNSLFTAITNS